MIHNFTIADPNCYSGGKYCALNPGGRKTVAENLNQICIYKIDNRKYWNYIEYYEKCVDSDDESC
jgi:hypothetical protein